MNRKIIVMFVMALSFCSQIAAQMQMVIMEGQYNDSPKENKPTHRLPPVPISFEQDNRCIIFDSNLVDETIEVVGIGGLLYTAIITKNGKIKIPEYISGEVELRLIRGNVIYHATIIV